MRLASSCRASAAPEAERRFSPTTTSTLAATGAPRPSPPRAIVGIGQLLFTAYRGRSGELSFGSSTETGDYHDHLGTKTGPNAHDTHLDVTIHHDTASVAALGGSRNTNALSSQLGADSFIYKMDATTGKPSSLYAMDTMPIDGNLYGNGTNGPRGDLSYVTGLDSFDLAGEADVVAAIGGVLGRMTFPGTPDQELTNGKNSCYDPWVAKINVATNQVVWATKENIDIPAPTDPKKSCDSAYCGSLWLHDALY